MTKDTMKKKLLNKFGKAALEESCWIKSKGRTGDIDELDIEEIELIYNMFFPKQPTAADIINQQQEKIRLRDLQAIILKDAQYIGLHDPQDFAPFNNFMIKRSPLKKVLPFYKIDEFDELIKQFKSLRSKYEKEAKVPYTKAWYHKNKLPIPSNN